MGFIIWAVSGWLTLAVTAYMTYRFRDYARNGNSFQKGFTLNHAFMGIAGIPLYAAMGAGSFVFSALFFLVEYDCDEIVLFNFNKKG